MKNRSVENTFLALLVLMGLSSTNLFACPQDARVATLAEAETPNEYFGPGIEMSPGYLDLRVPNGTSPVSASLDRANNANCKVTEITQESDGTTHVCIDFTAIAVEDQWNECFFNVNNGQNYSVHVYFIMK